MKPKITLERIIFIAVIIFLLSQWFSNWQNYRLSKDTISGLNSEIKKYQLDNGQLVSSKQSAILTAKQFREQIANSDKTIKELTSKFSKIKSVTKTVTNTRIDTIVMNYTDSIPCVFERKDAIFHDHYSLAYKSTQHGVEITDLAIPDSIVMVSGYKRKWFLGRKTQTFDITHSNPFVEEETIQHIEIQEKKRFYQTDVFKIGVGLIGGFLIAK